MDKPYTYITNCVNSTYEDISPCVDQAREITYQTFLRHVSFDHLMKIFPFYDTHPGMGGLMIKNDWAVSYYRSKFKGQRCYYVSHSAIEYIFVNQ